MDGLRLLPGCVFRLPVSLLARLSRRVGGVPRVRGSPFPCCRGRLGWSARCEGLEAGDRCGGLPGPWPAGGKAEGQAAAAADDPPRAREETEADAPGVPPAAAP